jgi:SAM-dependent methyltransferase
MYAEFSYYYEMVFPFRPEVHSFLKEYINRRGQKILDIGCGSGHYTRALAEDGFAAIGIDLDGDMIESARTKYPGARFFLMNMLDIDRLKTKFNLIFAIGNVIAHIPQSELINFLKKVRDCLHPNGYWVFQVVNWDYILKTTTYTFPVKQIGTADFEFHREYDPISSEKVTFKTCLKSGDDILFTESVPLYPVNSADYIRRHREMGFKLAGHYADFQKKRYVTHLDKANIFVYQIKS